MNRILKEILVRLERGWVADKPAVSADGRRVDATSIEAISWSLFGAIAAVVKPMSGPWDQTVDMLLRSTNQASALTLLEWSEEPGRRKQEILSAIRRAMV